MNDDELDRPEEDGYSLVIPFVACHSQGGPYDDQSFVAGYQAGQLARSLAAAAVVGATEVKATVNSDLVKQLDLIAMHHGFIAVAEASDEAPTWTFVTFRKDDA